MLSVNLTLDRRVYIAVGAVDAAMWLLPYFPMNSFGMAFVLTFRQFISLSNFESPVKFTAVIAPEQ